MPWGCLRFVNVVFPNHTHYFVCSNKHETPLVCPIIRLWELCVAMPAITQGATFIFSCYKGSTVSKQRCGLKKACYFCFIVTIGFVVLGPCIAFLVLQSSR